jgi:hypothetical protein
MCCGRLRQGFPFVGEQPMRRALGWLLFAALSTSVASGVLAQDDTEETAESAASADQEHAQRPESQSAPEPPPNWWFGGYLQGAFVPSFMLRLFLGEAPTVANAGFGVTATHRDANGMSFIMGLGYASYSFNGPYRAKGDPDVDTEYLQSTLGLLHVRAQVMWSTDIVPSVLSFEYGVGLDLGFVLGSLKRTEAYRDAAGNYFPCAAPGSPNLTYCEPPQNLAAGTDAYNQHGAHYGVIEKSIPPVMLIPMLPALALRLTPIPKLAIKLDAAFGLLQFSIGASIAYGINL